MDKQTWLIIDFDGCDVTKPYIHSIYDAYQDAVDAAYDLQHDEGIHGQIVELDWKNDYIFNVNNKFCVNDYYHNDAIYICNEWSPVKYGNHIYNCNGTELYSNVYGWINFSSLIVK